VVLDGVVDPTSWISSNKVTSDLDLVDTPSYVSHQFFYAALIDAEKVYSGLTDGCAAAGRAGCKLIEITGDNATGDDVKTLLNYVHDVSNCFFPGLGNPINPVSISGEPRALPQGDSSSPRPRLH